MKLKFLVVVILFSIFSAAAFAQETESYFLDFNESYFIPEMITGQGFNMDSLSEPIDPENLSATGMEFFRATYNDDSWLLKVESLHVNDENQIEPLGNVSILGYGFETIEYSYDDEGRLHQKILYYRKNNYHEINEILSTTDISRPEEDFEVFSDYEASREIPDYVDYDLLDWYYLEYDYSEPDSVWTTIFEKSIYIDEYALTGSWIFNLDENNNVTQWHRYDEDNMPLDTVYYSDDGFLQEAPDLKTDLILFRAGRPDRLSVYRAGTRAISHYIDFVYETDYLVTTTRNQAHVLLDTIQFDYEQ